MIIQWGRPFQPTARGWVESVVGSASAQRRQENCKVAFCEYVAGTVILSAAKDLVAAQKLRNATEILRYAQNDVNQDFAVLLTTAVSRFPVMCCAEA